MNSNSRVVANHSNTNVNNHNNKCKYCNQPKKKHDLCDNCREKVETSVTNIMMKKISGDWQFFDENNEMTQFFEKNYNLSNISAFGLLSVLSEVGPFLVCV